jgi:hypothetical protein
MNLNGKGPVFAIANKKGLLFGVESHLKNRVIEKPPKLRFWGLLGEAFRPNEPLGC